MLRVLSSGTKSFASSQSIRCLSSKPRAVHGDIVDQDSDYNVVKDVLGAVNTQIEQDTHSRLFSIVHFFGKQFKVTAEDIITVQAHFPADVGETIRLNKVLLAGSTDFTLIGKPLLEQDLVRVYGTIIEKTLGYEFRVFRHEQRTRFQRSYFHRNRYTMLRINGIEITRPIDH